MKIGTWNVNGIRKRFTEVISWIDREEPDVVCLQETKASREQVPEPLCSIAGYHSHWHGGTKGYSGVALLLCAKTFGDAPEFVHPPFDLENRIVVAEVPPRQLYAGLDVLRLGRNGPDQILGEHIGIRAQHAVERPG